MTYLQKDVIDKYKLNEKVTNNGSDYIKVQKGIHELTHRGLIVHQILKERFHKHDYHQINYTPGFWTHDFSQYYYLW